MCLATFIVRALPTRTHARTHAYCPPLQVLRTEGIGGFWKGNALNVLRTAPFKVSRTGGVRGGDKGILGGGRGPPGGLRDKLPRAAPCLGPNACPPSGPPPPPPLRQAVNFFSFDMYHAALLGFSGIDGNMERFLAGACAGAGGDWV